jgi:hypothetical protein
VTAEADTLIQIRACLADLDGYIDRRALALADPIVEHARAEAAELVRAAEFEAQRQIDLARELRRVLAARDRQTAHAEAGRRALAGILGHQEPSALPLADLVAQMETRLAEKDAAIEQLRAEVLTSTVRAVEVRGEHA